MRLRFVGLHEDGTTLVFGNAEGETSQEYYVPVDASLRLALQAAGRGPSEHRPPDPDRTSPRQVQTMMRAGQTSADIAEAIGWSLERVRKFEGPILAEREYIAERARLAHVRGRVVNGVYPMLGDRVSQRLAARGVDLAAVEWDATRPEGGRWTVSVAFVAGNRLRHAAWGYEVATKTIEAFDDEARWLSEDEQALPAGPDGILLPGEQGGDDLVSTIRQHNRARSRRGRKVETPVAEELDSSTSEGTGADSDQEIDYPAADERVADVAIDDVEHRPHPSAIFGSVPSSEPERAATLLPLEDLPYDPDTMGPPPAASRPEQETQRPRRSRRQSDAAQAVQDSSAEEATLGLFDDDDDAGQADLYEESADKANAADRDDDANDNDANDDDANDDDANDDAAYDEADTSAEPDAAAEADADGPTKRKGRTSVPSWDDIMFGARGRR